MKSAIHASIQTVMTVFTSFYVGLRYGNIVSDGNSMYSYLERVIIIRQRRHQNASVIIYHLYVNACNYYD